MFLSWRTAADPLLSEFQLAITSLQIFLNELVTETNQEEYCRRMFDLLYKTYADDKYLRIDLDMKYRLLKKDMADKMLLDHFYQSFAMPIGRLKSALTTIHSYIVQERLDEQYRITGDIIHMNFNRIFSSRQKEKEMVTYYFYLKTLVTSRNKTEQKRHS